jgi:hypothetical protein
VVGYSHALKSDGIQEVVGSTPIGSTKFLLRKKFGAPSLVEGLLPLSSTRTQCSLMASHKGINNT